MSSTVLLSVGIPTVWFIGGLIAARISYSSDMNCVVEEKSEYRVKEQHNQAVLGMMMAGFLWPILVLGGMFCLPFAGLWYVIKRFVTGGFQAKRNRYLQGQPIDGAKAS